MDKERRGSTMKRCIKKKAIGIIILFLLIISGFFPLASSGLTPNQGVVALTSPQTSEDRVLIDLDDDDLQTSPDDSTKTEKAVSETLQQKDSNTDSFVNNLNIFRQYIDIVSANTAIQHQLKRLACCFDNDASGAVLRIKNEENNGLRSSYILLIGNATSIGTKWGQENKASIVSAYNSFILGKDSNKLRSFASLIVNITTELNCLHWINECHAIADVLEVDHDFFVAFEFGRYRGLVDGYTPLGGFHECKSFVCYPPATRDDQIIFHKTRDNFGEPQAAYMKQTTELPPGQETYKFFGTMGVSDIGLSFFINENGLAGSCDMGGGCPAKYTGLMNHMTLRYIAEYCQNVTEVSSALHFLVDHGYTAGAAIISNYLFIDAEGNALHIADNGYMIVTEEFNPHVSGYPGIWSTVSITPMNTLLAQYGDIDVTLVDSELVGKHPDVSGASSSISGGTFLIHPLYPETLSSIFISLPAKAYSVPTLMGANMTPKALMNGAVYEYQKQTFTTMNTTFEAQLFNEWQDFYDDIEQKIPGQNVEDECNEKFSFFTNWVLNPSPLPPGLSDYVLHNMTQTGSFTHLNISSLAPYDSLGLYMPFDTTTNSTKVYDYSSSQNHGTYYADAKTNMSFGKYGGSLHLDGTGDYIGLSKVDTVGGDSAVTLSAWLYIRGSGSRTIFEETFSGSTNSRIFMNIQSDNKIRLGGRSFLGEGFQNVITSAAVPLNQWIHILGVINVPTDTITIYVNGVPVSTTGTPNFTNLSFPPTNPSHQNIGKPALNINYFNGFIDEFMLFNVSLTPSQVSAIYQGQSERFVSDGWQLFDPLGVSGGSQVLEVKVDVTTNFQNLQGSNLTLKVDFYNGSWQTTPQQTVTGLNRYIIPVDSSMIALNYSLFAGEYSFYSPVWLSTSVSVYQDYKFSYLTNATHTKLYGYYTGTTENLSYNLSCSAAQLTASKAQGSYISPLFNGGGISSWHQISWQSNAIGELADNQQQEDSFVTGNVDMSNNVLLMHMNEGSGQIVDSSGTGNHGTGSGITYGIAGRLGTAIGFDGINDRVTLGSNALAPDLNGVQGITFSTWINPLSLASGTSRNNIVDIIAFDPERSGLMLSLQSNGRIWFGGRSGVGDSSFQSVLSDTTLVQVNTWQHIAGVLDFPNDKITLYYNGVKVKEGTVTFTSDFFNPGTPSSPDVIGSNPAFTTHWFHGAMDELAVWGRRLSQQEIIDVYQRGVMKLNFSVRGSDQENWVDINDDSPQNLTLPETRFFQYKIDFSTANVAFSPKLYNVTVSYLQRRSYVIALQESWNLISLPFNETKTKSAITVRNSTGEFSWQDAVDLDIVLDSFYNYTGTNYIDSSSLAPGQGYWVWAYQECELLFTSYKAPAETLVKLQTGWNMMGLPVNTSLSTSMILINDYNQEYTWDEATTGADPILLGFVYGWNTNYQTYVLSNVFEPGNGYWMYAFKPCYLKKGGT